MQGKFFIDIADIDNRYNAGRVMKFKKEIFAMNNTNNDSKTIDNSKTQPIDAITKVFISSNKLEAYINIEPPKNFGLPPNVESLRIVLSNNNVIYGIIERILDNLGKSPIYNKNIIVARGVKPINGVDGSYKILFRKVKDLRPKERKDGTVDFHNLDIVENVKKDQALCHITLPTPGTNGISVTGEKIPCIKGKPVPSLLGKNTRLNKDGTEIYATIDGQVDYDYDYGKINVSETLFIEENVDVSTGNIKVSGNIIVKGGVHPGFSVEADGNIEIHGGVSSATLISGGNIILRSGAIGSDLNCNGNLTSRFIENSKVLVKGNIKTDYIMNSNIKCGKTLQTTSSISKIVGGVYLVGENIEARIIGSTAGVNTHIELGTDSSIIKRQQELLKNLPSLLSKAHSLKSLISLLRQYEAANRLTPEKKNMLDNAVFSYQEIDKLIENGKKELDQIGELINTKGYGRIICRDTIHAGTTVKIGPFQMKVDEPLICRSLYYSEEGIRVGTIK